MGLKKGLHVPLVHVSYAPGGNIGNLNWFWHSTATNINNALQTTQPHIEEIRKKIPLYHIRAMRRNIFDNFVLVIPTTKKSVLQALHKNFVRDCSASANLNESAIGERVKTLLELEEPSRVYNLSDNFNDKANQV